MNSMLPGSGFVSHYRLFPENSGLTYSFSFKKKKKIKNVAIKQVILQPLYEVASALITLQKLLSAKDSQIT